MISQSFAEKGGIYGYGTTTKSSPQILYKGVLEELKERLRNTYVENLSFDKIIQKHDRPHTFFFCDPPYFETCGYGNEFREKEHILLRDILNNIKGKFLLTINDHEKVREWYKDFNFKEVEVMYSVSKEAKARKNYKELIITNY